MTSDLWAQFFEAVLEEMPRAQQLRWQIHQSPQVSGNESETRDLILKELGNPTWEPVAETGGVVRIGPADGPAIGVRAELDALPIVEDTGAEFSSTNGAMHACGHDIHMAAAFAIARAAIRTPLPFAILLVLQPREEAYPSGARDISESEILERHDVHSMFGAHVHPRIPAGGIAVGAGAVNAASDEFRITIRGSGGHAAYPHQADDSIVAMAAVIGAAQTVVSRTLDPMRPAVLSFGNLSAGSVANVLPSESFASGTIRTMDAADRETAYLTLTRIVSEVAEAYNCSGEVELIQGEPVLYNDPRVANAVSVALQEFGATVVEPMRSCGADDFSYYTEKFPGLMMFVGTNKSPDDPPLHSSRFLPEDASIYQMAMAYAVSLRATYEQLVK